MYANRFRGAEQCPKILWVLQGIENQHEGQFAFLAGALENVNYIHVGICADFGDHALVVLMDLV